MNKNSKTVMVVDDDPRIVKALALRLSAAGYGTVTTYNGMTALVLATLKRPDLIITDVWMPGGCGLSMAYRLRQLMPTVPLIFLTASKQPGLADKAKELGAQGFLEKPYDPAELLEMVARLLEESFTVDAQPEATPERELAAVAQ
ncbi:MAG TPA: response regulator [Verrucomicrobiae bacterium]